eukprot:Polyplicarium_translucidae@DN3039_c0_g1_i4.p1
MTIEERSLDHLGLNAIGDLSDDHINCLIDEAMADGRPVEPLCRAEAPTSGEDDGATPHAKVETGPVLYPPDRCPLRMLLDTGALCLPIISRGLIRNTPSSIRSGEAVEPSERGARCSSSGNFARRIYPISLPKGSKSPALLGRDVFGDAKAEVLKSFVEAARKGRKATDPTSWKMVF